MPVATKSIYEPAAPEDGTRVLASRYWPRGVKRDRVDVYLPILGPSRELLRAFKDGEIDWPVFRERYLAEMADVKARDEVRRLAARARDGTLTVMCTCRDESQCHRRLLKGLVEAEMR